MTVRQQLWISMAVIILLAVGASVVDFPQGPDITWKGELTRELKIHLGLDLQGGTSLVYEADVSEIPQEEQTDAMAGVRDVLERRINAFGVSEPVIQTNRAGESWRVLVELPGVTDINDAVQQIGETPLLEFKTEVDELPEEQITAINELNEATRVEAQELLDRVLAGEDFAALAAERSDDTVSAEDGGDLGYFGRDIMVEAFEEAVFNAEAGTIIPELVQSDFGYHIIQVTDKTTGNADALNNPELDAGEDAEEGVEELVRASHILLQTLSTEPDAFGPTYGEVVLTGSNLTGSSVQFDGTTGEPLVTLDFDKEGADIFEQVTTEHIGETIAIFLDGEVISNPVVNDAISNGEAVISGGFQIEEANTLARRLNAGALPVSIELINQRNVGPTLGVEAIERSVVAGALGIILLAIFMIIYYRWPGFVAVIALGIYGLLLLAIFKLWPITLTLSGVAGFILSLGIAVDANVLIFERLKEELRNGKSLQSAIDDGFKRAWLSIRDSNVSSLITCFILIWFRTSVIKGFAITLAIGIVLSMFSAITITRTLLKVMPVKNKWLYGIKRK